MQRGGETGGEAGRWRGAVQRGGGTGGEAGRWRGSVDRGGWRGGGEGGGGGGAAIGRGADTAESASLARCQAQWKRNGRGCTA